MTRDQGALRSRTAVKGARNPRCTRDGDCLCDNPGVYALTGAYKTRGFVRSRQGSNACVRRVTWDWLPWACAKQEAQRNGFTAAREMRIRPEAPVKDTILSNRTSWISSSKAKPCHARILKSALLVGRAFSVSTMRMG